MDLTERLDRSIGAAREVLAQTTPDQYGFPTPCAEWDVRQLVNHTIGALVMVGDALTTSEADVGKLTGDLIGDVRVHGWDLARATRMTVDWDQALAADTLTFIQSSFPPEMRAANSGKKFP